MEKSPLSGAFHASAAPEQKKKKSNKAVLLVSGFALATSLGGVFAATTTITVNDGTLEFGQGLADATVCDTTIDTELRQSYNTGADEFYIDEIIIDSVDTSACNGKTLTWSLLDSAGTSLASGSLDVTGLSTFPTGSPVGEGTISAGSVDKIVIISKNTVTP